MGMTNPETTFSPGTPDLSTSRVFKPASAHRFAATGPPNPAPTTITSYSASMVSTPIAPEPGAARRPGEAYRVVRADEPACAALQTLVQAPYSCFLPHNLVATAQADLDAFRAGGTPG